MVLRLVAHSANGVVQRFLIHKGNLGELRTKQRLRIGDVLGGHPHFIIGFRE